MSSQRVTAAVAAEDRSAHPAIRGVPWWAAILIAVAATLVGCAIDAAAGNGELTTIFSTCYVVGCIAAVLAVRHTGIFTAVVQPPLILFVTIPGAYYLLHSSEITGVKDLVINCFYPLIERFVLMFVTALLVLLIGAARWYFESSKHRGTGTGATPAAAAGLLAGLVSRVRGLVSGDGGEPRPETARRTPRNSSRSRTAARPPRPRTPRPAGDAASRSRHVRPPMDDPQAPVKPRRRPARPRDADGDAEPPRPRRAPRDPDNRRESWAPDPWQQRTRGADDPGRPHRGGRRYGDPFDLFGSTAAGDDGADSHLPYSNVRYRGSDDAEGDYRRPRR